MSSRLGWQLSGRARGRAGQARAGRQPVPAEPVSAPSRVASCVSGAYVSSQLRVVFLESMHARVEACCKG